MEGNITAQLEIAFVVGVLQAAADLVQSSKLWVICVLVRVLHPAAVEVPAGGAEELGAAGFSDQLDDATADVAVLWFKPARLDLNFLHEGQIDTGSQWTVHARPYADSAEGRIVNGNAISNIEVFKPGGTRNRRILRARIETRGDAWRQIEEAAYAATKRDFGIEAILEFGIYGGGARVHGDGGGANLNGLRHFTSFQDYFDAGRLVDQDFGCCDAGNLEAGLLNFNRIESGNQGREKEGALIVGGLC